MSMDIASTLNILIKLGIEIKTRLNALNQAAEDLQLLNTNLLVLCKVFEDPANEDIFKNHSSEFLNILNVLESIVQSCTKCARALDIDIAIAATVTKKKDAPSKSYMKRIWTFNKIPDLLAEIRRKAEQLQKIYSTVSAIMLYDIRSRQQQAIVKRNVESTVVTETTSIHGSLLDLDLKTDFTSIDQIIGTLLEECKDLRQRLQEATLFPDTSAVQDYQAHNPEAASFWKNRFQKDKFAASALRYETVYVSWARFVHEIEASFTLKRIPTVILSTANIDLIREQGTRYIIDHDGTRNLSTIRPLWLPALQSVLDPLYKGYVKPQDFFYLLHDSSLSETLRNLALENAGYGILVECERESGDIALPAIIECPSDHVGWISGQIVGVPTPAELGIVTEREVIDANSNVFFTYFKNTTQDVHVYVRYLQTGQIERKSLSNQVRPIGGISVGAALSIRYELESGDYNWSSDLRITEFKACYGGKYIITAGIGSNAVVFCTIPLKNSFEMLQDHKTSSFTIPNFDCKILGPSKTFVHPPKVGEKIQVEYNGFWYDSRVTDVDGDEIEYTDWDSLSKQIHTPPSQGESEEHQDDGVFFFFPEELLTKLGKGTRRLWGPWRKNIQRYDVRPYHCFHIGDSIEAPVMYPDFRFHYHTIDESELYLPARIVDVQGDQYVVEFNPALSVHGWWPGRMLKGQQVHLIPGSLDKIENPFDFNTVMIAMDRVRPFSGGPRPVLGAQSAKPHGWNSFQGVHFSNLENLMERSLWNNNQVS